MVTLSLDEIAFPDPSIYHPLSGLMAMGGDLSVERVLLAYQLGIFPWYNPDEEILWWCPDPRFVLFPDEIKVSKSMRKILQKNQFQFTENQKFLEVIENCKNSTRTDQDGTWINDDLINTIWKLHLMGIAKSVEVWQNGVLVGGLYGLQIGRVFCGESMFSLVNNASKAGFIYFVQKHLHDYQLIDCQVHTPHLESLGASMIPKMKFLQILNQEK